MIIWNVHAASSAVAGVPSDHFIPGRILNVHVLPSADWLHDSANPGIGLRSLPNPTRKS